MSHPRTRILCIVTLVLLLAPLALPAAAAQLGGAGSAASGAAAAAAKRSVGTFDVAPREDGAGSATGAATSAIIDESASGGAEGALIKDFTITGGGSKDAAETVFSSIDVKGFEPTSRLEGVGTSALSLKSEKLVITLSDSANSLLTFRSTGTTEQEIVFNTAADVVVQASATAQNVWEVKGKGTSGALVLVQSKGQESGTGGSHVALDGQHRALATLKQGTQLVYRANAVYGSEFANAVDAGVAEYNEAAVKAVATGRLAGEATSEFSTGLSLIAEANFFATAQTRTATNEVHRVTTTLRNEVTASACASASAVGSGAGSAASGPASAAGSATATAQANACAQILAYDLDYVDIPAQTADQVAVYVNGALAQRVDAASQVAAHADSYWATTVEGRVLVLANVAAKAHAATQVTIAALAQGEAAASTLAELDAYSHITHQLEGGYQLLGSLDASAQGSGQVIGSFGSFFASEAKGAAEVRDFTDVRSATTIFARMHFAADVAAQASAQFTSQAKASAAAYAKSQTSATAGATVKMVTSASGEVVATTEFYDSVYAAFIAEAEAATQADLTLTNDVSARFVGDAENVLALDGPAGNVGHLILMRADGTAASASRFDLSASGHVKAVIAEGEQLVFRGSNQAQARAAVDASAEAIANGALASEATIGMVANAVASAEVDWQDDVHLAIDRAAEYTHKGLVTLDYVAEAKAQAQAQVIAVAVDRATLAARSADDIVVKVDGQAAAAVQSSAAIYAMADAGAAQAAEAQYYALTSLQGQTWILIGLPATALEQAHRIEIESKADAAAQLMSALDVFGSFRPGYGGIAEGEIVSLVAKPENGLILDYTLQARSQAEGALRTATTVFDAVHVGESAFASASASTANSIRYVSDDAVLEAYDVSSATMRVIATADTLATFDLGQNIEAVQVSDDIVFLNAPDFHGALILTHATSAAGAAEGALELDGQLIAATLEAGSQILFKAFSGFEAELGQAERMAQAEAIAKGALLGQVIVDTTAGASAFTTTTANINYYDDVKAITSVASSDKVEILVDSASEAGKTLVISFDRETVEGLINGDAVLKIDGKEVEQASSYADAFVADGDKYWLITSDGEVGLQAIVTLAHFSTRTITIETPSPPSLFLWTTIGLGVVVVGQALWPRLRRDE